jgi:hypothetical protein
MYETVGLNPPGGPLFTVMGLQSFSELLKIYLHPLTFLRSPYHLIIILGFDNVQNYWGFGLLTSSGILGNRGHVVSETGSVSVFR